MEVLPGDGTTITNLSAREALSWEAERQVSEEEYETVKERALAHGMIRKGRGRGGAVGLAEGIEGEARTIITEQEKIASMNSLSETNINTIFNYVSMGEYAQGVQAAKRLQPISIWELAHLLMRKMRYMLPNKECTISASSCVSHQTQSCNIQKKNTPTQFIFHTNDKNPWVIVDFATRIPGTYPVYLYNRCQSQEISARIIGCRFWTSIDRDEWNLLEINLTDEQIYHHHGIEIRAPKGYRYLKIDRIDGLEPIHLSQITIGIPLTDLDNLSFFLNHLLADEHNLKIAENNKITEHAELSKYISFNIYNYSKAICIEIAMIGRFSNFLIQITNVIHIAHEINIRDIYLPECQRVRDLFPSSSKIVLKKYSATIHIGKIPDGICLEGDFFYSRELPIGDKPPMRSMVNDFREYCGFSSIQDKEPRHTLTIHIRSGDIFENNIHPGYGQPPLSFYLEAICHFKPDLVELVFENDSNPVIPELIKYLEENSLHFQVQTSRVLRDDLNVLINSTALVIGNGTFANGVICFSERLLRVYTFNGRLNQTYQGNNHNIENIVIDDATGQYKKIILSNNWSNTPEQRELMVSYDRSNLSVRNSS